MDGNHIDKAAQGPLAETVRSMTVAPSPDAIRKQLQSILTSRTFQGSARRRQFLTYVVDECLAGRADRIKAYSIGISVFGRDAGFDPTTDPIVRIEAGRIRAALDRYYDEEGGDDPIRIVIERGGYVPDFTWRRPDETAPITARVIPAPDNVTVPAAASSPATRRAWRAGGLLIAILLAVAGAWFLWPRDHIAPAPNGGHVTILVQPLQADGDTARGDIANGLTREIITDLTRFNDLIVLGPETTFGLAPGVSARDAARTLGAQYVLQGSLSVSTGKFRVSTALIAVGNGQYVWSRDYEGSLLPAELFGTEDLLASEIVRTLAQPYGIIFDNQVKAERARPAGSLNSYTCVMDFYQYWRNPMPETFAASRHCLEQAVVDDPKYASAHSALASLYGDMVRYGMARDGLDGDPLARALDLAKEAVALEPRATHGFKALHLIYWLMHRPDDSFAAARAGLDLNPNDTELLADLGTRLCVTGRWEDGYPLLQQALARNPALGDFYHIVPFLKLYKDARYEEALAEAQRIHLPRLLDGPLAKAAAAAELGRGDLASSAVADVLRLDPAFPEHAATYLANRGLYRALAQKLIDSWRKAGMKIAEDARG